MVESNRAVQIRATDYVNPDGSVVHSGMALADAVLSALEHADVVEVMFAGIKGASSSYFNVFLRRIEEGCGLAAFDRHIHMQFASKIQQMVFSRSLESIRRATPNQPLDGDLSLDGESKVKSRLAAILTFWKRN